MALGSSVCYQQLLKAISVSIFVNVGIIRIGVAVPASA